MSTTPPPPGSPPPQDPSPGSRGGDPPAGDPPSPPEGDPPPPERGEDAAALKRRVEFERRRASKAEQRIKELEDATASDAEKATNAARDEGRSEGVKSVAGRLAAAEFRAQAAGKLTDPAAALEYMDMTRFVNDEGEPDTDAIGEAIGRLAAAAATTDPVKPKAPVVPNGVLAGSGADDDWLRSAIKGG